MFGRRNQPATPAARMLARAAKALGWIHRNPTDAQYAGEACILCGDALRAPGGDYHRRSYGFIGLRHRVYVCEGGCILDVVDDVEELFSAAIPADQPVCLWHLGTDDNPLTTSPDGSDMADEAYTARIDAQPKVRVQIVHDDDILNTGPLPADYAHRIAVQAQRLGFTAMIDEVPQPAGHAFLYADIVVTPEGSGIVTAADCAKG